MKRYYGFDTHKTVYLCGTSNIFNIPRKNSIFFITTVHIIHALNPCRYLLNINIHNIFYRIQMKSHRLLNGLYNLIYIFPLLR